MKKNFTLIELLVVIAIIAILAGLVMPALGHAQAKGRTTECINNKKQIMTVLRMYGNDHTSMIPYMISVKYANNSARMRPYSWILAGFGHAPNEYETSYSRELVSKKVLVCNTATPKDLRHTQGNENTYSTPIDNGTNAVGMVDLDFGDTTNGWYHRNDGANRKKVGRFIARDTASHSVAYVLEKMKSPSNMILLGDSFAVTGGQEAPFWTFRPDGGTPTFNAIPSTSVTSVGTSCLAAVHAGSTTVAYADGRAESLTPAQLKTSDLGVSQYYDDNFEIKDL